MAPLAVLDAAAYEAVLDAFASPSGRTGRDAELARKLGRVAGCRHPHAVRILARAWLRMIWACWRNETPYDPARRHQPQHPLAEPTLT